ncbi:MAG TPA: type II secretion system F family protein [Candidatus Binatia bacterium]|nr:type II secretion system F family protein [Candidatus Binatia bacterium]
MPRFTYRARSRAGQKVDGIMLADNEEQLAVTLREMDLYLVDAKPEKAPAPSLFARPVQRREIINFTVHLSASIGAGIPILQAFEDLEQQTTNRGMKKAIQVIMEDLRGGSSLSVALSRHPLIFSDIYCNMVKAGETSGSLVQVLQHLTGFLEWQESLASEIKRAAIYPAIVLTAVLGFIGLLLGFVFPRIIPVIESLKVPLPSITLAIMAISDFVQHGWYFILMGVASLVVLFRLVKVSEGGQLIIDAIKLRLPVIGGLIEKICLSRFSHHLGLLLRTGVDISQSLSIAERVVGNKVVARAVSEAREKVIQGGSLWRSLQETGVFPPLVIRMIFVGETTGTIDNTLEKVTQFYDREVPNTVKKVFTILEPLVVVMLAGMVLLTALSVFVPFYNALGKIGRR